MEEAVRTALAEGVRDGVFPGAAACVLAGGRELAHVHKGRAATDPRVEPLRSDMLYDVASLTKVIATTPVVLDLVHVGSLDLDRPLSACLPDAGTCADVTPRQLLAHCSGLPDWRPYYERYADDFDSHRQAVYGLVRAESPDAPPGTREVYSDLGFWLLQELVERLTGRGFADLVRGVVLAPLGLSGTHFCPGNVPAADPARYVPTERCPWRGRVLRGEVHDDNAWAMGGACAHAGLFATARDVARFGALWLDWYHARRGPWGVLPREFSRRAGIVAGSDRCLGWDGVTPGGSSSGTRFGSESFGHTGFTGTSIWIDPETEVVVVLLSNRVHPARDNLAIKDFRPRFHDAVMEALLG